MYKEINDLSSINFQIRQEGGGEGPTILKRKKQDDIHVFSHAYLLGSED